MEEKMAEMRNGCGTGQGRERDMVCIDTYRVLDSCRDKDCFEDVKVYLTCTGQDIIDHTNVIRAKGAHVLWSYIDMDTVPFNRGFYQLNIRIYVKLSFEACVCPGNVQEFDGIAVVEKRVILFGSEGNVSVFKSESQPGGFCACQNGCRQSRSTNLPVAVLETVDPIILSTKIVEPRRACCTCCCAVEEIPENVSCMCGGALVDSGNGNTLVCSLGFFCVVRIERPAQYLIHGVEYCVPEKECVMPSEDDPCSLFRKMAFPTEEFCPPNTIAQRSCDTDTNRRCTCGGDKT